MTTFNLSEIILRLEGIAWRYEHNIDAKETTAAELEIQAETLFRLAGRVRKDGKSGR